MFDMHDVSLGVGVWRHLLPLPMPILRIDTGRCVERMSHLHNHTESIEAALPVGLRIFGSISAIRQRQHDNNDRPLSASRSSGSWHCCIDERGGKSAGCSCFDNHSEWTCRRDLIRILFLFALDCSSKDKSSKVKNGEKPAKETSLRERAVAKLKILNFNINWDVHMKPCGWVVL